MNKVIKQAEKHLRQAIKRAQEEAENYLVMSGNDYGDPDKEKHLRCWEV